MTKSFVICLFAVTICLEILLRGLSLISYQIRFYTNNPYQRHFLDDVIDWKGFAASTLCPMPPGSVLNGFVINSRGNISPEVSYTKQQGMKRIVLLGDSHAVGSVPYPDHFIRVLERRLNAVSKYPLEVINLGLNCVGPAFEEKVLATEGVRYRPDVVILAFFVGNDFTDDRVYREQFAKAKKNERHALPQVLYESYLLSFFRNYIVLHGGTYHAPTLEAPGIEKPGTYVGFSGFDSQRPSFPEKEYLDIEKERSQIFVYESGVYSNIDAVWGNILAMKKISESIRAKFAVLIIPDELQMNMDLFQKVASLSGRSTDEFDLNYPQNLLKNFFEKNDIDYIDAFSSWKTLTASESYYLVQDSHLNTAGNAAVADLLQSKIQLLLGN